MRRVMGIRRKARRKVYPWILVSIAALPAVVFVGLAFFMGTFSPGADSPFGGHAEYMALSGAIVMLFVALAAPELLIPDREEGVLAVYSSRPMTAWDYISGQGGGAVSRSQRPSCSFPNILMYVGFAALDSRGLGSALVGNIGDLGKVMLVTLAYIVGYGAPALLISTYAKRTGPAAGIYLAIMFGSAGLRPGVPGRQLPGSPVRDPALVPPASRGRPCLGVRPGPDRSTDRSRLRTVGVTAVIIPVAVITGILMHRRYRVEL